MEDEKIIESGLEANKANYDALTALKELKEKTVSKEKYEKLEREHAELLKSYVEGNPLPEDQKQESKTIKELREATFKEGISNIEFAENSLKLREAILEESGEDIFVPKGKKIIATEEDYAAAQRVADVLEQCIDSAEGDNQVFTNELQRRTIDIMPSRKR